MTAHGWKVDDDVDLLRWVRRTMHRFPEPSHQEYRTVAFISGLLSGLGLAIVRPAPTSLAVVVGPPGKPTIGFRADLDAIACHERTELEFASENEGVMHACGHDGHTAALVLLARRLVRHPPTTPVLLVFQQGEEAHPCGARKVITGLGSELWPVEEFYGIHLWPELPENTLGLRTGLLMAGVSGVTIAIRADQGRSHGTRVDEGSGDALRAMIMLCLAVESIPSGRRATQDAPAVLHVGAAQAGEAPNSPAVTAEVNATLRWLDRDARDACLEDLARIVDDVASRAGVEIAVSVTHDVRPVVANSSSAVEEVARRAVDVGLRTAENYPAAPLGVSDDFGFYLDDSPGAMVLIGCGVGDAPCDLHSPEFDFREEVLLPVVDLLESLARRPAPSNQNLTRAPRGRFSEGS